MLIVMLNISMNIYSFLFNEISSSDAFEDENGNRYSYQYLENESAKVANWIKDQNWPTGSRILSQIPKSINQIVLYLGTIRSGMVYVPLNTAYTSEETKKIINDCDPIIHFQGDLNNFWNDYSESFSDVQKNQDDPAAIIYTSGTTGPSKGAILTHGNLISNTVAFDSILNWNNDVMIHCLPTFHAHGLFIALHSQFYRKGKSYWLEKFDVSLCLKFFPKSTLMMGVPTMYYRLVRSSNLNSEITRNIRAFISASAPLPRIVAESFYEKTGKEIIERYGTTESLVISSNPLKGKIKRGTVGLPLPGTELRIKNDEVEIKSSSLFCGYWNQKKSHLTEDGWFKTGDQGFLDSDGYLSITGRTKDVIISGGLKISPLEIESVIEQCKGVKESAVIGIPDQDYGEYPFAVVVADEIDVQEIKKTLALNLSKFKIPKAILMVKDLPKNDLGKIQKNILRSKVIDNITDGIIFYI